MYESCEYVDNSLISKRGKLFLQEEREVLCAYQPPNFAFHPSRSMAASAVSSTLARVALTVTCGQEKNRKFTWKFLDSSDGRVQREEPITPGCRMKLAFRLDKTKIALRSDVPPLNRSIAAASSRRQYRPDRFQRKVTTKISQRRIIYKNSRRILVAL